MKATDMIKKVDKEIAVPAYQQIGQMILKQLGSGKIKPGEKIPSESQLCEICSVSKITVRQAVSSLVDDGLLKKVPGKGTFVLPERKNSTKNIAVVLYHIDVPFYSKIVKGIEEESSAKGYNLILCNTLGDEDKEEGHVRSLIEDEKVDGFLICPKDLALSSPVFGMMKNKNIPFVVFPQAGAKKSKGINYVITDDEKGAYDAVRYLIRLGHKKIGFLTVSNWEGKISAVNRWRGYRNAMAEAGLGIMSEYVIEAPNIGTDFSWLDDDENMGKINNITAVFCIGDPLAICVMKKLSAEGFSIPGDLSIIGFDNIDMSGFPYIDLTTVEQPALSIGKNAASILIKSIQGKIDGNVHMVLPTRLIVRKTTGALRAGRGRMSQRCAILTADNKGE